MYCKHCGKEISETAKFCDGCGKPVADEPAVPVQVEEKPAKKKKKRHPILGTIVLIFGLLLIVSALGGGSDEPKKVESSSTPVAAEAPVETTEAKPFTVGDTLEMNNILVTLEGVSENSGSQFMKPTDGNVFVTCEFTIENNSNAELAVSSMLCFQAYFDDYAANLSLGAMSSDMSKNQLDGTVAAGKKMNGVIGFEAPKDWTEMEIRYTPTAVGSDSFVFIYEK